MTKYFVLLTSFIVGTCILILEILGTRLISPFYGNTIYVWSSLITVTLLALTGGYAYGGRLADRSPSPETVFYCIGVSGVWIVLLPFMINPVLIWTSKMGLAGGSLMSALLLFTFPLFFMGSVSPQFIRILTTDINNVGRNAGSIYAVSTLGSVIGALSAGFILIPSFGVRTITFALAFVLLTLTAFGIFRQRRTLAIAAFLLPFSSLIFAQPLALPGVIWEKESLYGRLRVVENRNKRGLLINGVPNSSLDLTTGETSFAYIHLLELVAHFRAKASTGLLIGMGGGNLVDNLYKRHGIVMDSVEIDPGVVEAAKTFFNFNPVGKIYVGDGRAFLSQDNKQYDIVVMDAFNSELQPYHLMTDEFFKLVKSRLNKNGVCAINFIYTAKKDHAQGWQAVYKTLKTNFTHVRAPTFLLPGSLKNTIGHIIFFASDDPLKETAFDPTLPSYVTGIWARSLKNELKISDLDVSQAPVLTDNYNPIDTLMTPVMVDMRMDLVRKKKERLLN